MIHLTKEHVDWKDEQWDKILWSDETWAQPGSYTRTWITCKIGEKEVCHYLLCEVPFPVQRLLLVPPCLPPYHPHRIGLHSNPLARSLRTSFLAFIVVIALTYIAGTSLPPF
jgi:hypothetical protein